MRIPKLYQPLLLAAGMLPVSAMAAHGFNSVYAVSLQPLNNSGVTADAVLAFSGGDTLRVILKADNLTANQAHAMHVHGLDNADDNASCPNLAADTSGDNLVTVAEGAPFYGGIQLNLAEDDGSTPSADDAGTVVYSRTITLGAGDTPDLATLGNPSNRTIVLHGLDIGGNYDAMLPVACGQIELVNLQQEPVVDEPEPPVIDEPEEETRSGGGSSGAFGGFGLGLMLLAAMRRRWKAPRS